MCFFPRFKKMVFSNSSHQETPKNAIKQKQSSNTHIGFLSILLLKAFEKDCLRKNTVVVVFLNSPCQETPKTELNESRWFGGWV
jgi:hypothetical protein